MKRKKVQVKMRNIFERDKYKTPITKKFYTKARPPPPILIGTSRNITNALPTQQR